MDKSRIIIDPKICSGKPVIRGTRIMVKNILGLVAAGYDLKKILECYPQITKADVQAALLYATKVVDEEKVIRRA